MNGDINQNRCFKNIFLFFFSSFKVVLLDGLGVEDDSVIGDGQLRSSTAMAGHEAWRGRLNGAGNWKPEKNDPAPVYLVKFYSPVNISYIATQGAPDEDCWVTSFTLRYKLDQGSNFTDYPQVCSTNCCSWTKEL